jgi:hypothetical protein
MTANLRPMTLGEILDSAIQMFKSNLGLFAGIAALPAVVSVLQTMVSALPKVADPMQHRGLILTRLAHVCHG